MLHGIRESPTPPVYHSVRWWCSIYFMSCTQCVPRLLLKTQPTRCGMFGTWISVSWGYCEISKLGLFFGFVNQSGDHYWVLTERLKAAAVVVEYVNGSQSMGIKVFTYAGFIGVFEGQRQVLSRSFKCIFRMLSRFRWTLVLISKWVASSKWSNGSWDWHHQICSSTFSSFAMC